MKRLQKWCARRWRSERKSNKIKKAYYKKRKKLRIGKSHYLQASRAERNALVLEPRVLGQHTASSVSD